MSKAQDSAEKHRSISIAEFFEKNRQILGFDSKTRSLLTCVKEAVDNALDACEEAEILPDIFVVIKKVGKTRYRISVEDNGPGIEEASLPRVFAKLLYGSRFHAIKQSRGQQGIGISAAVLYAQITTGKPINVISRRGIADDASYFELMIDTLRNEPAIIKSSKIEWDRPHGTRVELEIEGAYIRDKRRSVFEYLKETAIVNPHARLHLVEPDGTQIHFERGVSTPPPKPVDTKPHPDGVQIGVLMRMLGMTAEKDLESFLKNEFSRIGKKTADTILENAGLSGGKKPQRLSHDDATRLLDAFRSVKLIAPTPDCLSPLGNDLIVKGIKKEYKVDFIKTVTRKPAVHAGDPFIVEVALCYGGELSSDDRVKILRYANRVPLLYQQGGCVITHSVEQVDWKRYGIKQVSGGFPVAPLLIMVHVASTNIPFTSESKDAIADIPVIAGEITLALKDLGRSLKAFLSKEATLKKRREKEMVIARLLPLISARIASILGEDEPDIQPVIAKIMNKLLVKKAVLVDDHDTIVTIEVTNFTDQVLDFRIHDLTASKPVEADHDPTVVELGSEYDLLWKIHLGAREGTVLRYKCSDYIDRAVIVEGVDDVISIMG
ncbi:MAG: DNA topoisomerase VI subunit B [Candidatus Syntrophoarchaeum sp.]|nr:DNA topoisomerase VI subunit B [Candidatus Syntrophoarchaeum sp.]